METQRQTMQAVAEIGLDTLPFPAAVLSQDTTIAAANAEWLMEYPAGGVGQGFRQWCEALHSGTPDLASALGDGACSVLRDGQRYIQEYGGRFLVTISPCPSGALVLHQELRSLETVRQRAQAQRMEIVGRLVGGVAHDFANVITLIDGYSDILLNRISKADALHAEMDEIRKAARHGARLTSQLLGFTRGQTVEPAELDLNQLIGEMQRMLRPIIGEYVTVESALSVNLGKVVADRGQMEQVIVNLILNARDAMPNGGTIRIDTSNGEIDEAVASRQGMAPGPCVLVSFTDTGCGIEAEALDRVFEPFFTTKEKGKGTGLGLTTVRDIVRQSGGDIRVRSEAGKGTVFTICLPRVPNCASHGVRAAAPAEGQPGHETVLLVEDEESVRRLLNHLLERRGYRVLEAANAEEALRVFGQRAAEIHLVLSDVVMPGMSGPALAEKLREQRPETPIIFMSGYTDDVLARTGALAPGMSFLQKPLRPDVLVAKVREALDSASRPFNPR